MGTHSRLLPGKSHGWRSLVGCSPWGHKESDTTERLHFHFPLSCIGEGNGNPLQYSCLENPRDSRAWWAAIYGVTELDTTEATQQQQHSLFSISSLQEVNCQLSQWRMSALFTLEPALLKFTQGTPLLESDFRNTDRNCHIFKLDTYSPIHRMLYF